MKWRNMFQELELFGVATVNSKGTCEVGEECRQEPNNVKRPFLLVPGPLKGKARNPRPLDLSFSVVPR